MANTQQFSLRWKNYLNHITGAFDSFRANEDFVDVTLSCQGRKIKAHKMLLSACSAYFREIFKENPCQHPVIIFWNVKYDDLEALVTFMYQGEVSVAQECLSSFLNTAQLLEIQGLTSGTTRHSSDAKTDETETFLGSGELRRTKKHLLPKTVSPSPDSAVAPKKRKNSCLSKSITDTKSPTHECSDKDLCVDEHHKEEEDKEECFKEEEEYYDDNDELKWCQRPVIQHKYNPGSNDEYTTQRLSNLDRGPGTASSDSARDSLQVFAHGLWRRLDPSLKEFGCDECGKVFKHPRSLDHHKKMHEGRTTCPVCRKVFGRMYALRLHISSSHPTLHHNNHK